MKLLGLVMKRPTDKQIRIAKVIVGLLLIAIGLIAFYVQNLSLESNFFGLSLDEQTRLYLSYTIIGLGIIPLVLGGFDISILSRGRTRILQILFGILLFFVGALFVDRATIGIDILYFFLGFFIALAGISGKAITKKGLKYGQKITKIRV